jgi:hypothetical protein
VIVTFWLATGSAGSVDICALRFKNPHKNIARKIIRFITVILAKNPSINFYEGVFLIYLKTLII